MLYLSYSFTNLFKVHIGSFTPTSVFYSSRATWAVYIILSWVFQQGPSWNWSSRCISSRKFYPPSGVACFCLLRFYCFTRCLVQHIGYFLFLNYQMCLIWTISRGLRSVLEDPLDFFISLMFSDRAPKFPEYSLMPIWQR